MTITTPTSLANPEKPLSSNVENLKSQSLLYFKMGNKDQGEWFLKQALNAAQQENVVISCAEVDAIVAGKALADHPLPVNSHPMESARVSETSPVIQESQNFNQQILSLLAPLTAVLEEIKTVFTTIRELLPSLQLKETAAH